MKTKQHTKGTEGTLHILSHAANFHAFKEDDFYKWTLQLGGLCKGGTTTFVKLFIQILYSPVHKWQFNTRHFDFHTRPSIKN